MRERKIPVKKFCCISTNETMNRTWFLTEAEAIEYGKSLVAQSGNTIAVVRATQKVARSTPPIVVTPLR